MQYPDTDRNSQIFLSSAQHDGAIWRLFIPRDDSVTFRNSNSALNPVLNNNFQIPQLLSKLELVYEDQDDNLEFLKHFVNCSINAPEPYLEKRYGGCSASVIYYHGNEMTEMLVLLVNS